MSLCVRACLRACVRPVFLSLSLRESERESESERETQRACARERESERARERERERERENQHETRGLSEQQPGKQVGSQIPPLGTCPGGLFSPCRELARSCLRQTHGVYVLRALLLLKPNLARVPSQVHVFNKQVLGLACPTSRRGGKPVHNADLTARIWSIIAKQGESLVCHSKTLVVRCLHLGWA